MNTHAGGQLVMQGWAAMERDKQRLRLSHALRRWALEAQAASWRQRAAARVAWRWRNMSIKPALTRWRERTLEKRNMGRRAQCVVARCNRLAVAAPWATWRIAVADSKLLVRAAGKVLLRSQQPHSACTLQTVGHGVYATY